MNVEAIIRFVLNWMVIVAIAIGFGLWLPTWLPPEQSALLAAILACAPWINLAPAVLALSFALAIALRRLLTPGKSLFDEPPAVSGGQRLAALTVIIASMAFGSLGLYRGFASLSCG